MVTKFIKDEVESSIDDADVDDDVDMLVMEMINSLDSD